MGLNTRQLKKTPDPKKPRKPKDVIYDPMGQWNHPGEVTRIPGGDITMKGVPYPVLGIDDSGNQQMMMPGMEYLFPGAQYVTEYPQMYQTGGPIPTINADHQLPAVEVTADKPSWLTFKEQAEKSYPREKFIRERFNPRSRARLKNSPDPLPFGDQAEYDRRINDVVAENLLKFKYPTFDQDYSKDRLGTLGKLSPTELKILKNSKLSYKVEPSIWSKFEQGLLSLNAGPVQFKNPNLTPEEAKRESTILNITQPLSVFPKAVQSIYKNKYSLSDALSGTANNASFVEDLVTDPLNYIGIGLVSGAKKLPGLSKLFKATTKADDVKYLKSHLENTGYGIDPNYHLDLFNDKKADLVKNLKTKEGRRRLQEYIDKNQHIGYLNLDLTVDKIIDDASKIKFVSEEPIVDFIANDFVRNADGTIQYREVDPMGAYNWFLYGNDKPPLISVGKNFTPYDAFHTIEHEFGHFFQRGEKTHLDKLLSNITLKNDDEFVDLFLNESKNFNTNLFSKRVKDKGYSISGDYFGRGPNNLQRHKNYWSTGGGGQEKSAFAAEIRENLIQRGLIKDRYDNITPEILDKHYNLYHSTDPDTKYHLRLYDIMSPTKDNFSILSQALNKIPSVLPYVGAGYLGYKGLKGSNGLPQELSGDMNKQMYQTGGIVNDPVERNKRERVLPELENPVDMYGRPMYGKRTLNPNTDRSYYDPRLNTINLGSDFLNYPREDRDRMLAHENYHGYQHANDLDTYLPSRTVFAKPPMTSIDDVYYGYYNRKPIETQIGINNFTQGNPSFNFVPEDLIYNNIVDPEQYLDPSTLEGSAKFYEDLGDDFPMEYKEGGMIKRKDGSYSKRGLWDNIRANKGSGKKPTKEMLEQERKIKAKYPDGGPLNKSKKDSLYVKGTPYLKSEFKQYSSTPQEYINDGYWNYRNPALDSDLENNLEYVPFLGTVLGANDASAALHKYSKNPTKGNAVDAAYETASLFPLGKTLKITKPGAGLVKSSYKYLKLPINAALDAVTDERIININPATRTGSKAAKTNSNATIRKSQYADGGPIKGKEKPAIIVNDLNDPRLLAYNDSLYLHNAGVDMADIMSKDSIWKDRGKHSLATTSSAQLSQLIKDDFPYAVGLSRYRPTSESVNFLNVARRTGYRPIGGNNYEDHYYTFDFQKPKQPVKYKPYPKTKTLNINSIPINGSTTRNTIQGINVPNPPTPINPKPWDSLQLYSAWENLGNQGYPVGYYDMDGTRNYIGLDEYNKMNTPQYQAGGSIIVNDPNDPRLLAYNDSLSTYNNATATTRDQLNNLNTARTYDEFVRRNNNIIDNSGHINHALAVPHPDVLHTRRWGSQGINFHDNFHFVKPKRRVDYKPYTKTKKLSINQVPLTGSNTNTVQSRNLPTPKSPANPIPVDDIQLYSAHQNLANGKQAIGYVMEDGVRREVTADEYNSLKGSTITGGNKLDMINYKNGGIAFPQQPTMDQFFKRGWVPQGPVGFYQRGGALPEAFPQQPTAKKFFDFGVIPAGPVGFYSHGGNIPEAFPQQPTADVFFSGASWDPTYAAGGVPCMECGGYMDEGGNVSNDYKQGGQWIQKATASIKRRGTEGVCTGSKFGGPGCPPGSKRYNLAKTFRAMAKKRADGGEANTDDQDDFLAQYRNQFVNHVKNNTFMNLADEAAQEFGDMEENMLYAQYGASIPNPWDIARLQMMGSADPSLRNTAIQMTDPISFEQQNAMNPLERLNTRANQPVQSRGFNGEPYANAVMAGINSLSSLFNNAEDNIDNFMQQNSLADNQFYSMAANRVQDQGRYNWTGMSNGMMDPNSMNVIQQPGMNFARFQEGGEYELDDQEIDQILKMGGTIQYVK